MKRQLDIILRLLGAVLLLLIAVSLFNRSRAAIDSVPELYLHKLGKVQTWFSTWDVVGWGMAAGGGYVMGLREAFHADPTLFERRWGKSPTSFWGSEGWRRKYHDYDVEQGMKSQLFGNVGRDFWHTADKVQRTGLVLGITLPMVQAKRPLRQRLFNAGISMMAYSFCYTRGYNVRYRR